VAARETGSRSRSPAIAESYRGRLPKADIGRSCVRFKRLNDVDLDVIAELVRAGADFKPRSEAS